MPKDLKDISPKKRHTNGQQVHQQLFKVTNHQGNKNQKHTEI